MKTSITQLAGLALALAAAGCDSSTTPDASGAQKPNIVLLVVDTLRGDHVLQAGEGQGLPGFDSLAENGVVYSRAFSHAPMTLPAHASLFSSRAPFETGVLNNWQSVDEELPLLAEWLGQYGYQTHAVISLATLDRRDQPAHALQLARQGRQVRGGLARW